MASAAKKAFSEPAFTADMFLTASLDCCIFADPNTLVVGPTNRLQKGQNHGSTGIICQTDSSRITSTNRCKKSWLKGSRRSTKNVQGCDHCSQLPDTTHLVQSEPMSLYLSFIHRTINKFNGLSRFNRLVIHPPYDLAC